MHRRRGGILEVFLVHPGGPFWKGKDAGAWSVPKGEPYQGEDLLAAAMREFEEETGCLPSGPFIALSRVRQAGGKVVHVWAFEGDCDPETVRSNSFTMEWPPHSGSMREFPEIDRAAWFDIGEAKKRINMRQAELLEELRSLQSE